MQKKLHLQLFIILFIMKNLLLIGVLLLLVLFIQACASSSQKIELLKPEADAAPSIAIKVTESYISFPVTLSVADIETQTNKALNGLIYEDTNLDDDKTQMKIWKKAPIQITEENGKLKTVLPLQIWAKVKYGTSALGLNLFDTKEFNLNGILTLNSNVNMNNWKISTQTELEKIDWAESPTITILGKAVPITYLVNPTIKIFESKIEKSIDESLAKTLDFKENMVEMMQKVAEPTLMSPTYQTWLKINPQELFASNAILKNKQVALTVGLKCTMESTIGQKPIATFKKEQLVLKPSTNVSDKIAVQVAAVSSYEDASKIMNTNFKGKEFFSGKRKIKVENVAIWHKKEKMIIALDLSGSLNGKVYLAGVPQYNSQTKELYFDDLDYAIETKDKLIKTANWLAQGIILNKLKENCKYSIAPNLNEGKQILAKYVNNYSPVSGVFVNGKMNDIVFEKVQLTNTSIVAFISISGNINLKVNGM